MHVHVVTSHAIHPVPAQRPTTPRHPIHLAQDMRATLEQAGHRVDVHALPHEAARARPDGDFGPDFGAAARAGRWLAERIGVTAVDQTTDVVLHALDEVAAATALAARGLTGVPVVLRAASPAVPYQARVARQARQACLRAADAVVAPTAHDHAGALSAGVARDTVTVIPDVVVVPRGDGSRRARTRRVVSLSGAASSHVLVAALRWAPDCELVVAGDSPPSSVQRLLGEAARLGLASRVRWEGWVPRSDAIDLIDGADVVACAGAHGMRATTAVEAMWRGRPVVAADLPALAEAVASGTTGLLARPGDPRSLGAALRSLLVDPFRQEAFGQAGADRAAARYAPDLIAASLERSYRAAAGAAVGISPRQRNQQSERPVLQPPVLKEAG